MQVVFITETAGHILRAIVFRRTAKLQIYSFRVNPICHSIQQCLFPRKYVTDITQIGSHRPCWNKFYITLSWDHIVENKSCFFPLYLWQFGKRARSTLPFCKGCSYKVTLFFSGVRLSFYTKSVSGMSLKTKFFVKYMVKQKWLCMYI